MSPSVSDASSKKAQPIGKSSALATSVRSPQRGSIQTSERATARNGQKGKREPNLPVGRCNRLLAHPGQLCRRLKCRCCVRVCPCCICFYPPTTLDREVLVAQLKAATRSEIVDMNAVEGMLQQDMLHLQTVKKKWRRRWCICCVIFFLAACASFAASVIFLAIAPWTLICTSCQFPARTEFGAALMPSGQLAIVAGRTSSSNLADVWIVSTDGKSSNRVMDTAIFGARHGHALLCDRTSGQLYLLAGDSGGVGGADSAMLSDVWSSSDGSVWVLQTASAPWSPRSFFGAILDSNRLCIAGGLSAGGSSVNGGLNDVWCSQDKGKTWRAVTLAAQWTARFAFPMLQMQGSQGLWYILGGWDGLAQHDVWASADNGLTWQSVSFTATGSTSLQDFASWSPRYGMTAADSGGTLTVMGGSSDPASGNGLSDVWQLPPPPASTVPWYAQKSNDARINVDQSPVAWTKAAAPLWTPRRGHQSIVDGDGVPYVIGGEDFSGVKNDMWKMKTSFNLNNILPWIERTFGKHDSLPQDLTLAGSGGSNSSSANSAQ